MEFDLIKDGIIQDVIYDEDFEGEYICDISTFDVVITNQLRLAFVCDKWKYADVMDGNYDDDILDFLNENFMNNLKREIIDVDLSGSYFIFKVKFSHCFDLLGNIDVNANFKNSLFRSSIEKTFYIEKSDYRYDNHASVYRNFSVFMQDEYFFNRLKKYDNVIEKYEIAEKYVELVGDLEDYDYSRILNYEKDEYYDDETKNVIRQIKQYDYDEIKDIYIVVDSLLNYGKMDLWDIDKKLRKLN